MNTRLLAVAGLAMWAGCSLLLSRVRWFARRSLSERLRPYQPGAPTSSAPGLLSVGSVREVVAPLATDVGGRLARALGVEEPLTVRLMRIHSPLDPMTFRVRQAGWAAAAFALATAASVAVRPPPLVALAAIVAAPLLAFLVIEQGLAAASTRWQRNLLLELPVVCEQIGMLLSAGHSLGGALGRVAHRGRGAVAQDLTRVANRIRQGLGEAEALTEWADLAAVPEVRQVVQVLSLNRATSDLGRVMSREARSIRQEVQRRRVEELERRAQQVWIPVTVATLVPGVIFLAVPFIEALRLFSSA
ncbi:MAG TPA: type II secretion system F family protein [Acidimicrobiales bacterium]|jgi:Flp pilus assembly protein TadB|nr:type II secretion system F family protein [Acidimicrobiales bacterium]